jgi:hypothetical protein
MLVEGDEKAVGAVELVHLFVQRILAVTKDNVGEVLELTGYMSAIPASEFESQRCTHGMQVPLQRLSHISENAGCEHER